MKHPRKKKELSGLNPEFVDKINSASAEDIKAEMVQIQKGLEEAKEQKKNHPDVIQARENYQSYVRPLADGIKANHNRLKFMVDRLKEMGAL